jgi:hypothetical protein
MIINVRTALAANGVAQPLAGSVYEFVTEPSLIEIGLRADATGVLAAINSGPDTVLEPDSPINIGLINTNPVYPDDFYSDEAMPTDRLSIKLRDTSGAARVVMTQIRITPL